jgi:hypothetical protein
LYDLRSCVEHVKSFERELRNPRGIQTGQAFAFWSLCAELLSSELYKRIFESNRLRDCFKSERSASGFWRKTPIRRAELLGKHIDIMLLASNQLLQAEPEAWL